MAREERPGGPRDSGTELFRLLMALLVIVLHAVHEATLRDAPAAVPLWATLVDTAARCAVPFFFITSGYYLRTDRRLSLLIWRPIARTAPIFIVWLLIYRVAAALVPALPWQGWSPRATLNGSGAYHLWFLPALVAAQIVVAVGERVLGVRRTGLIVALLALAGPILFGYGRLVGFAHYPDPLRSLVRQLAAPAFVFAGRRLRTAPPLRLHAAVALVAVSYLLLVGEVSFLTRHWPGRVEFDVLLSTFLFGPAVFLLSRAINERRWTARLAPLGQLSLGVYLVHLFILYWIRRATGGDGATAVLVMVLPTMILAGEAAALMLRVPVLRRLVT